MVGSRSQSWAEATVIPQLSSGVWSWVLVLKDNPVPAGVTEQERKWPVEMCSPWLGASQ